MSGGGGQHRHRDHHAEQAARELVLEWLEANRSLLGAVFPVPSYEDLVQRIAELCGDSRQGGHDHDDDD